MSATNPESMTSTKLFTGDKLARTMADFDAGKWKRPPKKIRKWGRRAEVTLKGENLATARWLIDNLSWIPTSRRDAIENLIKVLG